MNNMSSLDLSKLIKDEYGNISGIIVNKDKKVVYEEYLDDFNENSTIHIASVTKSILSILVGISIKKGFIKSVNQKVLEFFPEYQVKRGEKTIQNITIKNLLTMTAPYKYKYEPYTKVYSSDDWTKAVLDLLGGRKQIGDFKYTTIGIQVLSSIIINATGQSLLNIATENLFKPLGITSPQSIRLEDKDKHMAFLKDKHVSGWVADPKGVNTAGWGLTLTTRDMMKIGLLYINKGKWEGQQIVKPEWIDESIKVHSKWGDLSYGYLWWIIDSKKSCYAALGDGGNAIYINPDKELVVAISSSFMPRAKDRVKLIKTYIEEIY